MILDLNLDNRYPQLLRIPYSYLTAIGPLILLYTRSLLEKEFKISKQELILFLPVAVEFILQVTQITYSSINNILYYNTPADGIIAVLIYVFSAASTFYYSNRSLKTIRSHEKWVERNFSNSKGLTLAWLYKLLSYYRILCSCFLSFFQTSNSEFFVYTDHLRIDVGDHLSDLLDRD